MIKNKIMVLILLLSFISSIPLNVGAVSLAAKDNVETKIAEENADIYLEMENELQKSNTSINEQLDKIIDEDLNNFPKEEAEELKKILTEDRIEEDEYSTRASLPVGNSIWNKIKNIGSEKGD